MDSSHRLKGLLFFNFLALGLAFFCVKKFVNISEAKGVVKGICYTIEDSTALVDENLVSEGDVINGVKIYKIEQDCVIFQKKDIYWSQHVRETPSNNWDTDDHEKTEYP